MWQAPRVSLGRELREESFELPSAGPSLDQELILQQQRYLKCHDFTRRAESPCVQA